MCYAFGSSPVERWRAGDPFPQSVLDHVAGGGKVRGWNVAFEHDIWNLVLDRQLGGMLPHLFTDMLEDTMARAAYWGLPLSLDKAGAALNLPIQKDKAGHKLMLQMCRPRSLAPLTWWHETDPAKFDQLVDYCATDVEVEREIANRLPELPAREQRIWEMDRRVNLYGVLVDLELVDKLATLATDAKARLNQEMRDLTAGSVKSTNQTAVLLGWLQGRGYPYPDLKKDTVKQALADDTLDPLVHQVLRTRRDAARASTAKLVAFRNAAAKDGRVRGMLQHYGAPRTGRWAGRLVQLQNIPRPTIKTVDQITQSILAGADHDEVDLLSTDSVMGVVASCLRGCIVAGRGNLLVSADLSQIEARVIAWLAGQQDVLDVFESGADIYTYDAKAIGSNDRQLGKVQRLGLGFGMGPDKFIVTAKGYGITLDKRTAVDVVQGWRANNPHIVQFWWDCDAAARAIANGDAQVVDVGPLRFQRHGNTMLVRLPSGRHLVYRRIRIEFDKDNDRDAIVYDGMNQYTRQWGPCRTYGGKLAENFTQAAARDVMADALVDMEAGGIPVVLSVHDEAIAEVPAYAADDTLADMLAVLTKARSWTKGLPIAAAGWTGPRYRKG